LSLAQTIGIGNACQAINHAEVQPESESERSKERESESERSKERVRANDQKKEREREEE